MAVIDSYTGILKMMNNRFYREVMADNREKPGGIVGESIHASVGKSYERNVYRPQNIPAKEVIKLIGESNDKSKR